MFIGMAGPSCSGKRTVANWLVTVHGFTLLSLKKDDQYVQNALHFDSAEDVLLYVTKNWLDNFVTYEIYNNTILEVYRKRPFFLLVSVDAPITIRYQRCVERCQSNGQVYPTLEQFVTENDRLLFQKIHPTNMEISELYRNDRGKSFGSIITEEKYTAIYNLIANADLNIINSFLTTQAFFTYLHSLDITNQERLRPSWDTYFIHLSELAAKRSNCMKRKVGCILVRNNRIISTGYNGTPRGLKNCNQGGCDRCNDAAPCGTGLDKCLCLHAEENALLEAGKERGDECILYCNTCPCLGCTVKLIQIGVKEVVYNRSYRMDEKTSQLLKSAGVKLRQHSLPAKTFEVRLQEVEVNTELVVVAEDDVMM
nr:5483_t:CDS:2 [Entrophospora candida]